MASNRLSGRVTIVTGSNSGIGRAIALAYAREGAIVICANRSEMSKDPEEKNISTNDLIKKEGGQAKFVKVSITDTQSVQDLVQGVVQEFKRIDVLVNNAGLASMADIWALSDADIDECLNVNLVGPIKMMRAVSGVMIHQQPLSHHPNGHPNRGVIINIGSVFGPRGAPKFSIYSASKSAVIAVTKTIAIELAPHGVRVHAINPGTVVTKLTRSVLDDPHLKSKALLGFGDPNDIAGPAVFLACDEAKWMTGSELFVDSGYTLP